MSRASWPHLQSQRYGRIVNTISSAFFGGSNVVSYGTAKGAVLGLSRSLAVAGAPHGIHVNAVAPMAWTRMMESAGVTADSEMAQQMRPELVSAVVAFLAHESCPANGGVYAAAGGRVARIFVGETAGHSGVLLPEDVRDNWTTIEEATAYFVPSSMRTYTAERQALLGQP